MVLLYSRTSYEKRLQKLSSRATPRTENQRRSTAIDMATALSNGAIRGIFTDAKPARPVVQLINAKAVLQADGSAPKKVKAEISDGEEFGVAVLTSTVAENLAAGKIGVNDAVCLKNYMVNQLGKTKICIVLDCERTAELGEKVGEPVSWEAAAAPPPAAPAATVAAAAAQSSTTPGKPGGASAATPDEFEFRVSEAFQKRSLSMVARQAGLPASQD